MKNRFHIDVRCDKKALEDTQWGVLLFWINWILRDYIVSGVSAHLVEYKKKGKK